MEEDNMLDQESESASSSDEEEDKEMEQKAQELEAQLSQNMYLYDVHVELVGLYQKMADLNSMRAAYERFHKYFPISPNLWLKWIQDEIKIASSPEEKSNILKLFDKAVEDYMSVDLWKEYAQFAMGWCSTEDVRSILERGLHSVGLHASQGSILWDTFREFELAHLSLAAPDTDQFSSQFQRVIEIYRRQLSVPLINMEDTYKEWEDFLQQLPDDHGIDLKPVEWGYKKATQLLKSYTPYEESLMTSETDDELYKIYKNYINFVKDPSLIITLYERAVSQLCLNVALWEDYCYYTIKLGDLALKVSEKALRNCPWYSSLWIARLRIMEIAKKSEGDVLACFEEAVKSVSIAQLPDLWLAYIEYIKRNSDNIEHFDKLCIQAKEQLDIEHSVKILRLQASVHAKNNDMTAARKIWSEIMHSRSNKMSAYMWIEYIRFEKQFGEPKHVRQLYERSISNCKDWQQYFVDEWMIYEREVGTVEDVLKCVEKCRHLVKYNIQDNSVTESYSKRKFNDDNSDNVYLKKQKVDRNKKSENGNEYKYKYNESMDVQKPSSKIRNVPTDINPEKTVFLSNFVAKITEQDLREIFMNAKEITIPTDRKGKPHCYAYVQFETTDEAAQALKKDRTPIDGRPLFVSKCQKDQKQRQAVFKYANKFEENKLFVKGLPKHFNREAVEEIFKPYKAVDVRLVTKFNGQPKGLAYVDFATAKDAELALKNVDQMVLGEHTITVLFSDPPNKKKEIATIQNKQNPRNSKTKLEIPFVPRSVQVKKDNPKEEHTISKTNDDFRKMLLNK